VQRTSSKPPQNSESLSPAKKLAAGKLPSKPMNNHKKNERLMTFCCYGSWLGCVMMGSGFGLMLAMCGLLWLGLAAWCDGLFLFLLSLWTGNALYKHEEEP